MKFKSAVYLSLLSLIGVLLFTSGGLLKKTKDYKYENRKLILQNDSLQAVVIKMNQQVADTAAARSFNKKAQRRGS